MSATFEECYGPWICAGCGTVYEADHECPPTIEQQIAELKAAGWIPITRTTWKTPVGGYFLGPHGAWKAMKRRERAA